MKELKFLEAFTGSCMDDLVELEKTHRVDSLVMAMETALDQRAARVGMSLMSAEERVILAVEALEREVNNGGYEQFFRNSSRVYAGEIEATLRLIGCAKHADIAKSAVAALGIEGDLTEGAIREALNRGAGRVADKLAACDEKFFAETEDIASRLFAFAKAVKSKIHLR